MPQYITAGGIHQYISIVRFILDKQETFINSGCDPCLINSKLIWGNHIYSINLFLLRNVLCRKIGDLTKTVRAKQRTTLACCLIR